MIIGGQQCCSEETGGGGKQSNVPGAVFEEEKNCQRSGWQELASFRQAQKMPSILSSDAYLLIRDKKALFFFAYYQNCNKKVVFT